MCGSYIPINGFAVMHGNLKTTMQNWNKLRVLYLSHNIIQHPKGQCYIPFYAFSSSFHKSYLVKHWSEEKQKGTWFSLTWFINLANTDKYIGAYYITVILCCCINQINIYKLYKRFFSQSSNFFFSWTKPTAVLSISFFFFVSSVPQVLHILP